ncbi:MAG: beta-galactosidase [Candidatus Hydrogenedentes bacterium]|nr:beta-galactosidase [Candidatus Hydrogenedentota bacterium]
MGAWMGLAQVVRRVAPVLVLCLWQGMALAESPVCKVISGRPGGPAVIINGETLSPIFFAANNQFGRDDVLFEQVKMAGDAGVDLISFNVPLDWDGPSDAARNTIDAFCKANPNAYFYMRTWVGGSLKWLKEHPEARIVLASGEAVKWASPASPVWRETAAALLRSRMEEILRGPHADRFIGVCLANMQTCEWFYFHANDSLDYSEANQTAFREWLTRTHKTDKRLQKAWGDPAVSLKTAALPTEDMLEASVLGPFRDPVLHRQAMDAQRFQSELVADAIAYLAKVVKEASGGRALAGSFYGYTLELNHNGPRVLARSGHLALSRLLECPDLDMIHAPYSYFERGLGQPGNFHLPLDSVALHGKLAVLEEDTFTHLATETIEGIAPGGGPDSAKTLEETLALNRRNYAQFFTHKSGFWYFDLLSDGRWNEEEFWKTAPLVRRMGATMRDEPVLHPEVAFVVSEDSVHALKTDTHPYLLQSLALWRHEVSRLGTTVGYYLQSDLPHIPDSVKLVILANPYRVTEAEERAVERIYARGGTVVWTFAPGIMGDDGLDVARLSALTGMTVKPLTQEGPFTLKSRVTAESVLFEGDWQPRFAVTSSEGQVLATYDDSGNAVAAARPAGRGVSVYTAVPRLPIGMLKWIGRNSGVHFYREGPGMVGVVGPYLIVHTSDVAKETFHWPVPLRTVERLVPYSQLPVALETDTWSDTLPAKSTVIYRCTP